MILKKGTQVKVVYGKDKGKTGEILEINKKLNKIKIKSINMIKRHTKPTKENNFVFLDNDGKEHGLPEQNEGDLIFFPSYIWHSAKPLKSGRRFVVAGNIEIKFIEKGHPV